MKRCKKKGCSKPIKQKYTYCFDHRKLHKSKNQRKSKKRKGTFTGSTGLIYPAGLKSKRRVAKTKSRFKMISYRSSRELSENE